MSDREQCTICLESLISPRQLPCRHSFCKTCLQEYINKLAKRQKSINNFDCPNCRTSTASPSPGKAASEWAQHFPEFPKVDNTPTPRCAALLQKQCGPCEYEGNKVDAKRYCADCREYICEECFSLHKRLPITRKHRVVKADDIRNVSGSLSKQRCSCPWNKKLAFHCMDHQVYCCSKCKADDHTECKDVKSIADMSDCIRFLGDVENAFTRMNLITENFQQIIKLTENNKSSLAIEKKNIIDSIKKIHADLRSQLSQIEDSMIGEVNTLYEKINSDLTEHVGRCKVALTEINTSSDILRSAQSQEHNDQLYISHNRFVEEMAQLEKVLHETAVDTMTSELCFQPNELTNSLATVLQSFGEISTTAKKDVCTLKLPEVKQRYRKAKQLKSVRVADPCNRTNVAVLPNGRCVVVNCNKSILMFDCNDQQTSSLSMPCVWDVCVTGENEVAVTTREHKTIHLLSTDKGLNCTRTISTDRPCYGIAYCVMTRELVITACYPGSVQIVTLTGDVVKTIEKDKDGQQMFSTYAKYVAVNDTGDMLYVSDWYKGVIGVDRDGHVKFIHTDVKTPRGISPDGDGNIYVCGWGSNDVHQLSSDGSKIQVLLSSTDELKKPYGLLFNRRNDTILVSCDKSQNILVYKMH